MRRLQSAETLSLDQARTRLPELTHEIDRLVLETSARRERYMASEGVGHLGSMDDSKILF